VSREQVLFDTWSLYTQGRGQIANKNLDSYHKMALGGPTAVRAYAGGESAGDTAVIGTTELRYLYTFALFEKDTSMRLAAFYDLGWSKIDTKPLTGTTVNTATRGGYGLELNIFWNNTIAWQLFWAHTADNTRVSQSDGKRSRVGTTLSASF
jgi:hemolysin activation/secretion protein